MNESDAPPAADSSGQVVGLPEYAEQLAAFHRAYRSELLAAVRSLPLASGAKVLDVGCGDGFYLGLFAELVDASSSLVGLDTDLAFLEVARNASVLRRAACNVTLLSGSLSQAPLSADSFDVVWCAQSLYSLPEPREALRQMARLVRPGGMVAVLENDTIHQVMLPWRPQLEVTLRSAELAGLSEESDCVSKFYVGRRLPALMAEAGLTPAGYRTQSLDRQAPLDRDTQIFLQGYLDRLASRIDNRLPTHHAAEFARLIDATSADFMLRQPHFACTCVNVLAVGRRPP